MTYYNEIIRHWEFDSIISSNLHNFHQCIMGKVNQLLSSNSDVIWGLQKNCCPGKHDLKKEIVFLIVRSQFARSAPL